jgi:coproporphyrinogen III oxidase-like Fe-S oxidoreductase
LYKESPPTLKLGIVYIGLESGDDEVLKKIDKGVDAAGMIEAARRVKAAGILTSVTVILGIAGMEGSEKHALETARVLSEMDPDYVGALTTTFVPGTPLHRDMTDGKFTPVSPFHSLHELMIMIEESHFTRCFFSSVHASNYFTIRGTLPQDKERMLAELNTVVEEGDPDSLRPEFLRGL